MKKLLLLGISLWMVSGLSAQSVGMDTLVGLSPRYGAFDNYQECDKFQTCPAEWLDRNYFWLDYYTGRGDSTEVFVTKAVTDRRLAIKGVAVMTLNGTSELNPNHFPVGSRDMEHQEESIMIWNADSLYGQSPTAVATWHEKPGSMINVAVPQCLQTMADSLPSQYLHFGLEEVCFDRAVGVAGWRVAASGRRQFVVGALLRDSRHQPLSPDG